MTERTTRTSIKDEPTTQPRGVRGHIHRVAPACLLALGVFGILESRELGLGDLTEPGPGLWPLVLASVVVAASAVLLVVDDSGDYERWTRGSARILAGVVGMAAYIVAFRYLGVAISTALLLGVWLRVFARETWRSTLVLTVTGAAVLYVIFAILLDVPFPEGVLGGGA